MSLKQKQLLAFDGFSYDPEAQLLRKGDVEVVLTPLASRVFDYLLLNSKRVVSKQDLKNNCWDAQNVEDNAVEKQIRVVRKALGVGADGESLIVTKYKAGWQLRVEVREIVDVLVMPSVEPDVSGAPELVVVGSTESQSMAESKIEPRSVWLIATAVCLVAFAAIGFAASAVFRPRDARILKVTPITNDGRLKIGPLLVSADRILFGELRQDGTRIVSVPLRGGDPTLLPGLDAGASLEDLSRDGKLILVSRQHGDARQFLLYSLANGMVRELSAVADVGTFGPTADSITVSTRGNIETFRFADNAEGHLLKASSPVSELRWSPNGRFLRFWPHDLGGQPLGINEYDSLKKITGPVKGLANWTAGGTWTSDGKYFFFEGGDYLHRSISVRRESGFLLGELKAMQLTLVPGSWRQPAVGHDDSQVFAIHTMERPELVGLDAANKTWVPMWEGVSATELQYSPDGKWVAFVRQPEMALWKARADGSEKMEITFEGIKANQPHWSPDGTQIAFMGQRETNGPWRIFIVPSRGGKLRELIAEGEDLGVPTWSGDGRQIVFGERLGKRRLSSMRIRLADVGTGQVRDLSESNGMWSPRWSPDGKHIMAVTTDWTRIRLFDVQSCRWTELMQAVGIDNAAWSYDSRWIYFDGRFRQTDAQDLLRVETSTGKIEKLTDLKNFPVPADNWFGVSPDGMLLASKAYSSTDIYVLKCQLP